MKLTNLYTSLIVLLSLTNCVQDNAKNDAQKVLQAQPSNEADVELKIKNMGIEIPVPGEPVANYVHTVRTGNLIFTAGKGPTKPEGDYIIGKLGEDLTVEQGYEAARYSAIQLLGALKKELGDLNKVKRIVKVLGMVNSTSDFTQHPEVVNGCSDLMVEIFGEKGKHARSAVGMGSLPRNIAVEIEMVVEVEVE